MNSLPREARWSLVAATVLGLFLAGLGAGAIVGRAIATASTTVHSGGDSPALTVIQQGSGPAIRAGSADGYAGLFTSESSTGMAVFTSSGSSNGVYVANDSSTYGGGSALAVKGRQNDGVVSTTSGGQAAAIRAQNDAGGVAIWAVSPSSGVAVYGVVSGGAGAPGSVAAIAGQANDADGIGVYGLNTANGQAGYFRGNVTVWRDLNVRGAVAGYTAVLAYNADSRALSSGDAVAIVGARRGADGSYIVGVAGASADQTAIGVADGRVDPGTIQAPSAREGNQGVWGSITYDANVLTRVSGRISPGQALLVATGGVFGTAKVSSSAGAVAIGDLVGVGDASGELVRLDPARANGHALGYALADVLSGTSLIPILIQPR